jgi:hypothetical protein
MRTKLKKKGVCFQTPFKFSFLKLISEQLLQEQQQWNQQQLNQQQLNQ